MKRLSYFKRPRSAKRILEIGGGHDPYEGVTHAVDKFPEDNTQRADNLVVPDGVVFRQGDLEEIPFSDNEKFDFLYASHVLEHVNDPFKAISEINRLSDACYIETPSPLREQISCPVPYDEKNDFHTLFCWPGKKRNQIHFAKKSKGTVASFCDCEYGRLAKYLYFLRREKDIDIEPLLPGVGKMSYMHFKTPVEAIEHKDLKQACLDGNCAYESARWVSFYSRLPGRLIASRFSKLKKTLLNHRREFFEIDEVQDSEFKTIVQESKLPVALTIWSKKSGSSQELAPKLKRLSDELKDEVEFYSMDVEKNSKTPIELNIKTIPTVLIIKNGKVLHEMNGNRSLSELSQALTMQKENH